MASRKKPTADPDAELQALQRQVARLQAQMAARQQAAGAVPPAATVKVDGGTAVAGSVQTDGGHFIGHDLVMIIQHGLPASADAAQAQSIFGHYLHVLVADLAGLPLGAFNAGVDKSRNTPLQLGDIYVPLDTTAQRPGGVSLQRWLARAQPRAGSHPGAPDKARPITALEALAHHRQLTLLGQPGSGKSTFGAHVLLALAQTLQGHAAELKQLGPRWPHGALLPVRIKLRGLSQYLNQCDARQQPGTLWAYIGQDLQASNLCDETAQHLQRITREHGALFLFDGLDECGDAAAQQRVRDLLAAFMRQAPATCRFLLTARPYAWPEGAHPASGVYQLAGLSDTLVEQFIARWYAALQRHRWCLAAEADAKRDDLLRAYQRADIRPLAANPLLLTQMAMLHSNKGRMPDDRADLYDESVALLLQRWSGQIGADQALLQALGMPHLRMADLRDTLEELAYDVHAASLGRDGTADIGEGRLQRAFSPWLGHSLDKAQLVVDHIDQRAGLLTGLDPRDGERQFSFPHRSFQEFLAACHLAKLTDFESRCVDLARQAAGHWQVVLPLAARRAGADRGVSAAHQLIGCQSVADAGHARALVPVDWNCALLAGLLLQEIGLGAVQARETRQRIAGQVAQWLVAALPLHPDQGGLPVRQRAFAGEVLAQLGDPRFDSTLHHLPADATLGFVRIEADEDFVIGTRTTDARRVAEVIGDSVPTDELNDRATPTAAFYIGKYPVTVAQFGAFVDASGQRPADPDALRAPGNQPVAWVSWQEARAYCDWLTGQLLRSPALTGHPFGSPLHHPGWQADLPSELEWEAAARAGVPGAIFPWGDVPDPERANTSNSGIDRICAVGCFPATGRGLHDMVGNVLQWTGSAWTPAHSVPHDELTADDAGKVVRGGAFYGGPGFARCAWRGRLLPGARNYYLGFRVVLRWAPVVGAQAAGPSDL